MKKRLMEILACPIDKAYPLELHVFEEGDEIVSGIIICSKCNRWYPIIDEIPHMLPDDLREEKEDVAFLRKWKEKIPQNTLTEGRPFKLG
ncbi:MAG: Trm112 family protein [Candidatus Bathyarchaeia archaeon]